MVARPSPSTCITSAGGVLFHYLPPWTPSYNEGVEAGYPLEADLDHADQAAIDRVAIGRVLVEYGYLTLPGGITAPIKASTALTFP
jgi:hypothetical protein